jgi:hypothetical protein
MTKNFSSKFRFMKGRRDNGGRMMSLTSEFATLVNDVAMLYHVAYSDFISIRSQKTRGDVHETQRNLHDAISQRKVRETLPY